MDEATAAQVKHLHAAAAALSEAVATAEQRGKAPPFPSDPHGPTLITEPRQVALGAVGGFAPGFTLAVAAWLEDTARLVALDGTDRAFPQTVETNQRERALAVATTVLPVAQDAPVTGEPAMIVSASSSVSQDRAHAEIPTGVDTADGRRVFLAVAPCAKRPGHLDSYHVVYRREEGGDYVKATLVISAGEHRNFLTLGVYDLDLAGAMRVFVEDVARNLPLDGRYAAG